MLDVMATPHSYVDTSVQRPATGLDAGARTLILRVVEEIMVGQRSSVPTQTVVIRWFFENRYGGYDDYMGAIESGWGGAERFRDRKSVV